MVSSADILSLLIAAIPFILLTIANYVRSISNDARTALRILTGEDTHGDDGLLGTIDDMQTERETMAVRLEEIEDTVEEMEPIEVRDHSHPRDRWGDRRQYRQNDRDDEREYE